MTPKEKSFRAMPEVQYRMNFYTKVHDSNLQELLQQQRAKSSSVFSCKIC